MDEQLVLTAQTLKLNPDLQRADTAGDVFVVKNIPARRYLTVSVEQWNLLRNFANPATVPDVLRAVILNRTSLPLREYYELVLKAHRAGILHSARQAEPEVRAVRWGVPLHPGVPTVLCVVSLIASVVLLGLKPFPHVGSWPLPALLNLLIGWVLLIAGVSIGQALAASVLRWGGGEVYEPRFRLLRPVPYFGVNLTDACMTSLLTQTGIWTARLMPVFATAAALWFYKPEWGLVHVLALVVMLRPFSGGSVPMLLSTLCRGAVLDTQKNFLFSLNRRWKVRLGFGLSRLSIPYLAARLLWGVVWIVLVVYIALRAVNQSVSEVFGSVGYWREVGLVFAVLAGAVLVAYIGVPAVRTLWTAALAKGRELGKAIRRWRVNPQDPAPDEQTSRLLAESLLFRRLPPAERAELKQVGTPRVFKAYRTIQKFTDKNLEVGVILSGRLAVYRRTKAGRAEKVLVLSEGDVFGAHALLDPERQQVQIRTLTPVVALMLPMPEFERRVLRPLGVPLVADLVHKVPFLRKVSFCQSWHPQAMARFAQLATIVSYNDGDMIVVDRQDSQQFYVIYEGHVVVKQGKRVRSHLRAGAFFGEISILQNSAAVSDVVAKEPTRCLTISKADFLRFVTHNPLVSLQLEEISSRRLGRPIFPLSGLSFDTR